MFLQQSLFCDEASNGLDYLCWGGRGFCLRCRKNSKPEKKLEKPHRNPASSARFVGLLLAYHNKSIIAFVTGKRTVTTTDANVMKSNGNSDSFSIFSFQESKSLIMVLLEFD